MFRGLEPKPQVSHLKNSTTTSALESNIYFILSLSCHFIFHVLLWHVYVNFLWTCITMLCFDNGSAHNLLVGSEPTHCCRYLYLRIPLFRLVILPLLGLKLLNFPYCWHILYPTFGGVIPYAFIVIIALFALCFAELVPVFSIVGFGILGIVSARPINE